MTVESDHTDDRPHPPAFYGLRIWWHEWVTRNEDKAATLRWRMNNATEPQECLCGARGTVAIEMPGFRGSVAPIHWACDEHADVPLTVPWINGAPQVGQARENCSWWSSSTVTDVITECGCGEHVGMTTAELRYPPEGSSEVGDRG